MKKIKTYKGLHDSKSKTSASMSFFHLNIVLIHRLSLLLGDPYASVNYFKVKLNQVGIILQRIERILRDPSPFAPKKKLKKLFSRLR